MKVGIIYICTGTYSIFWKEFYESTEKYFLPGIKKEYFVFSDHTDFFDHSNERIHYCYQKKQGWPYDTLMRWHFICAVQDRLEEFDFLIFMNSNVKFIRNFLPEELNLQKLMLITFDTKSNDNIHYSLERNPESKAYVSIDEDVYQYVRGGMIGGNRKVFLQAAKTMRDWINEDLKKGIIPIWHDESILNAYALRHEYSLFRLDTIAPEELQTEETIAIFRNKQAYGGNALLRNPDRKLNIFQKIARFKRRLVRKIKKVMGEKKNA